MRLTETNLEIVTEDNVTRKAVSELNLQNARKKLDDLKRNLANAVIRAPVSGVILGASVDAGKSGSSDSSQHVGPLTVGEAVEADARLLTIGDLTGLSIVSTADEIDIGSIEVGLPVRVSGDGFAGITLEGVVTYVSSEATGKSAPTFGLTAQVPELTSEHREVLRLGMTARLDVLTYEEPNALLVPLAAVDASVNPPRVRVRDQDSVREVAVKTGLTTLDSVQILEGLEAGAVVLVADG